MFAAGTDPAAPWIFNNVPGATEQFRQRPGTVSDARKLVNEWQCFDRGSFVRTGELIEVSVRSQKSTGFRRAALAHPDARPYIGASIIAEAMQPIASALAKRDFKKIENAPVGVKLLNIVRSPSEGPDSQLKSYDPDGALTQEARNAGHELREFVTRGEWRGTALVLLISALSLIPPISPPFLDWISVLDRIYAVEYHRSLWMDMALIFTFTPTIAILLLWWRRKQRRSARARGIIKGAVRISSRGLIGTWLLATGLQVTMFIFLNMVQIPGIISECQREHQSASTCLYQRSQAILSGINPRHPFNDRRFFDLEGPVRFDDAVKYLEDV